MADLLKILIFCAGLWWAFVARKEAYWFIAVAALPILAWILWGNPLQN